MKSKYLFPLILLVLILASGIYLVLFEDKPEPKTSTAEDQSWILPDPSLLNKLTLENETGKIVFQKNEGGWWQIIEPFAAPLDHDLLQLFIDEIAASINERTVDEDPEDLSLYQLDDPPYIITMEISGSSDPSTYYFGKLNPSLDRLYTKKEGENKVFLVRRGIGIYLPKSLDNFRIKILLMYPANQIAEFSIQIPDKKLRQDFPQAIDPVLIKQVTAGGFAWNIIEPVQEKAEAGEVKNFLETMSHQMATEAIDLGDKYSYSDFGLEDPSVVINMTTDNGNKIRIHFGRTVKEENIIYGCDMGRKEVLKIAYPAFAKQMNKDFRTRRLTKGYTYRDMSKITVEFPEAPGNNYSLVPVKDSKEWMLEGEPSKTFPRHRMQWVVQNFREKKFQAYIYQDPTPISFARLDPPRAVITLYQKEKIIYTLAVGKPDEYGYTYVLDKIKGRLVLYNFDVAFNLPPEKKYFFTETNPPSKTRDEKGN
jgi:hypothetical protein